MASMAASLPAVKSDQNISTGEPISGCGQPFSTIPPRHGFWSSKKASSKSAEPESFRSMSCQDDLSPMRKKNAAESSQESPHQGPLPIMPPELQVTGSDALVITSKHSPQLSAMDHCMYPSLPPRSNGLDSFGQRQVSAPHQSRSNGCASIRQRQVSAVPPPCGDKARPKGDGFTPKRSMSHIGYDPKKASQKTPSTPVAIPPGPISMQTFCRPTPFLLPESTQCSTADDQSSSAFDCQAADWSQVFEFEDIVHDVKQAVLELAPRAQVVLVCAGKAEPSDSLTVLGHEETEMPVAPANTEAILLAVENTPECLERAFILLNSTKGGTVPLVVVLLHDTSSLLEDECGAHGGAAQAAAQAATQQLAQRIGDFMENGAHDAIVCSHFSMNLNLPVAMCLARARVRVKQHAFFSEKVHQARQQCHELFWKNAHITVEGFPQMKDGMREVLGKSAGKVVFEKCVGKGAFGQVFSCRNANEPTGKLAAVKVFSKAHMCRLDDLCTVASEYFMLEKLAGHPNVIRGRAIVHAKRNIYIFMDYAGDASLYSLLKSEQSRGLPQTDAIRLFKCISDGLAHCHHHNVAHCDIKPENVVLAPDGCAKLVDFGEAEDLEEIQQLTCAVGTMPFIAPEVLKLVNPWNPAPSDVWALGVLLLELMCGENALPQIMQWNKQVRKSPVPERGDDLLDGFAFSGCADAPHDDVGTLEQVVAISREVPTDALKKLLGGMLQAIPGHRLTVADVVLQISKTIEA